MFTARSQVYEYTFFRYNKVGTLILQILPLHISIINSSDLDEEGEDDTTPSSSEDEEDEVQQLLSTLQRVYEEVCSPQSTSKTHASPSLHGDNEEEWCVKDNSGPVDTVLENWDESESEEDKEENSLRMFNKLEETRANLEDVMSLHKLMQAYTLIQVIDLEQAKDR